MLVIILLLLVLQNVLWYFILRNKIKAVLDEVKKGNKDQQEIKARLAWIKKRQYDIKAEVKKELKTIVEKVTGNVSFKV